MNKTIGIVGLGGLGGFVAEFISRLDFKKIILIDKDCFSLSNINRQLLCTKNTLDTFKVDNYKAKIEKVSNSTVVIYKENINEDNIDIIKECDLVFDCLDNIKSRLILSKACSKFNIPLVHGSIGTNFGQVALCLPLSNKLEKLYKDKEDTKLETNAYSVSMVASIQVKVALDYFNNKYDDLVDTLIYIDLEDLSIKHLKI